MCIIMTYVQIVSCIRTVLFKTILMSVWFTKCIMVMLCENQPMCTGFLKEETKALVGE